MKKSAVGIGLLILIALILLVPKRQAAHKYVPPVNMPSGPTRDFRSDYVNFTLPSSSWACNRVSGANDCLAWECRDARADRTDLAWIRAQARTLTESEKSMDGHWVDLTVPLACGPDLSQIPPTQFRMAMLQGTDWQETTAKDLTREKYTSKFLVSRAGELAIQLEIAVQTNRADELWRELKPTFESIRAHGPND